MAANLSKIDYSNKTIYVGLDVHTSKWYSTIICEDKISPKVFDANPEKLANYLKKHYPDAKYKAAYEAGCFGFWGQHELQALGIETIVINPADIPTSDKDKVQKNDKNDSRKIALALRNSMLESINIPTRTQLEHRALSRRRDDLVGKCTCVKNQIKSDLKFYGISYSEEFEKSGTHWSKKFVDWLGKIKFITVVGNNVMKSRINELNWLAEEIKLISKQLDELMQTEEYKEGYRIVRSVPGIGPIHGATFILEVMDIEKRFKRADQFHSYVGLVPSEHSSGDSRHIGHLSRRCNRFLRKIFVEASWIAIKKDLALNKYFEDLKKRGMKSTLAIVKVARKLANRLRCILKKKEEYKLNIA